jgi:hypothetical protein
VTKETDFMTTLAPRRQNGRRSWTDRLLVDTPAFLLALGVFVLSLWLIRNQPWNDSFAAYLVTIGPAAFCFHIARFVLELIAEQFLAPPEHRFKR